MLANTKVIRQLVREAIAKVSDKGYIYKSWTDKTSYTNPSDRRSVSFALSRTDETLVAKHLELRLVELGYTNPVKITISEKCYYYLRVIAKIA